MMEISKAQPADSANAGRTSALYLLAVIAVLAVAVWLLRSHVPFHWSSLVAQLHDVTWWRVGAALVVIYLCYWLRAARWAVLLAPMRRSSAMKLLPAQVIGFTAVAIFGRVADLARPYMIARRTQTAVTTQIAIYSIERAFDLGAAAILFSAALAFAPPTLPHHQLFVRAGVLSVAVTLGLAVVAALIRFHGERIAAQTERLLHGVLPKLADAAAARVLDLQHGFGAISSFGEFISAMSLSLLMWGGIASCYLLTARAFGSTPELANFSFSATMLLLATGIGGGVIQLPVLGWFSQIALFATTLHVLFGVPLETATACAATVFTVMNLSIVPTGLIIAHLQGIGLRDAVRSEVAA
jgi:uncharacterized membrane protein YbhN (UPF0104 family)